jgi:hypothetical protein
MTATLRDVFACGDARCALVVVPGWPWMRLQDVRRAITTARPGEYVMCAVALNLPLLRRLGLMLVLRWQRRRIEGAVADAGGEPVAWYGVEPSLEAFACVFQLSSAAACYADRYLRPRGSLPRLRQALSRGFGCDPALGGVMLVSRKRS